MIQREEFIAAVRRLVGCPVTHRGRDPRFGVDCVGVPIAALASLGVQVRELHSYGTMPSEAQIAAEFERHCARVNIVDRQPGDLLQVRFGEEARHVVVLVGTDVCVEAVGRMGRVREVPLRPARVRAAWRLMVVA